MRPLKSPATGGARRRVFARVLLATALVALGAHPRRGLLAEVELSAASNVVIREEGPFDTAGGVLSDLLAHYLVRVLGKTDLSGPGPEVTFVLKAKASYWHQLPPDAIEDVRDIDAFEVAVASDPRPAVTITGQTPLATGYGVMHFLDKHLDVFWAFPGELGLCLPKRRTFRLGVGTECVAPWVVARLMSGLDLRGGKGGAAPGRRMNGVLREHRGFFLADDYFKSLRLRRDGVTHNMIHIFPVEQCRAEHPDLFPMTEEGDRFVPEARDRAASGGQKAYQAWHPCYTHPKAVEIAVARGREQFGEGRLFYSLGVNDGRKVQCRCPRCRSVGWPQSYYRFVNEVAEALKDYYPPQMVGVLAYGDVGIPPDDLRLPENVLVNVAGMRKGVWESLAPSLGTYEYIYGAGYVVPNLPLEAIRENTRYYQTHGLRMYRAEFYPVWAFDAPKAYVISRLLWDPDQDVYGLLRTFCDRTFGEAGEAMCRYYEHVASIRAADVRRGQFTPIWNREWPFREPLQMFRCPADLHERLAGCLDEAKAKDVTTLEARRLAMVEAFTEFSAVYCAMDRLAGDVFAGRADPGAALARAADLMRRKDALWATLGEHPEWFAGSSVRLDTLHERPWPTRRIEEQLEAAVATASLRLAAGEARTGKGAGQEAGRGGSRYAGPQVRRPAPLKPLRREEHPWYKPTQHVPIQVLDARGNDAFPFRTAPNAIIEEQEDPRHHGKPKAQWLHGLARNLPVDERTLYVAKLDFEGRKGMLLVRLHGVTRCEARRQLVFAHRVLAFADEEETASREVVIDPMRYLAGAEQDVPSPSALNVQLYLTWRPDDATSHLRGTARLDRITIGSM
jgi:hypothetical protein